MGIIGFAQRRRGGVAVGAIVAHIGHNHLAHGRRAGPGFGVLRRQGLHLLLEEIAAVELPPEGVVGEQAGVDFRPAVGQVGVRLVGPLLAGQLKVEAVEVIVGRGHVRLIAERRHVFQHPLVRFGGRAYRVGTCFQSIHFVLDQQRNRAHAGLVHGEGLGALADDFVAVKRRNTHSVLAPAHWNGALEGPVLEVEEKVGA